MPLEFSKVAAQIENMVAKAGQEGEERRGHLRRAVKLFAEVDAGIFTSKIASCNTPWPVAGLTNGFNKQYDPSPCPGEFTVIATDGSHIEVDRHSSVRCYLINIGSVVIRYGANPDAHIDSEARVYFGNDLMLTNPVSGKGELIEGALLGAKRSIEECSTLADVISKQPPGRITLAMIDGSLVLWGLSPQDYEGFIREELLDRNYLFAFDHMKKRSAIDPIALCAYTSFPRNSEVMNALRVCVCGCEPVDCERCRQLKRDRECDDMEGITDGALFDALLGAGQRSAVFQSGSYYVKKYYGEHKISFFYMKSGDEIARIEIPQWVAGRSDLIDMVHTLVLDQCRRGLGYPVALMEAHEKAVVTVSDREAFRLLVERALFERGVDLQVSGKSRSKRGRWV